MKTKILVGTPSATHINLAMDEVQGLTKIGYKCDTFIYTRNNALESKLIKLIGVLKNSFKLIRLLYQFKPDILYLNSRFGLVGTTRDYITTLIIRFFYWRKLNIAIKTHGSDFSFLYEKSFFVNSIMIPYLSKHVMLWFFLSQEEKNKIAQMVPEIAQKAYVTGNIIDPARSVKSDSFMAEQGLNDNRFKFFFAGRMIAEKGIFSIIRAIPDYKYKEESIFILAGNGEEYDEVKNEIKQLQIEKYVHLAGFVPEEECDHFFANTDALVFPTYFDEGFPMALFKAVGSGLPIITTKTRAAIDHLNEPDNCLWVNGKDPRSVADALNTIFENEDLREKMKKHNRILGENFTREKITQQMHLDFCEATSKN